MSTKRYLPYFDAFPLLKNIKQTFNLALNITLYGYYIEQIVQARDVEDHNTLPSSLLKELPTILMEVLGRAAHYTYYYQGTHNNQFNTKNETGFTHPNAP